MESQGIAAPWIARSTVAAILRRGSPGFPRQHSHPDDYLRRTLARAAQELAASHFLGAILSFTAVAHFMHRARDRALRAPPVWDIHAETLTGSVRGASVR